MGAIDREQATAAGDRHGSGPDLTEVRARLLQLDPRYRYSAALTHATGLAPWDPERTGINDLAGMLEERPEDAFTMAILHARGTPEWAASRAGRVEAIITALAGVDHDAAPRRMEALAEYSRQLQAALTARQRGTPRQDAAIAEAARLAAGEIPGSHAERIRGHLEEAAAALGAGDRSAAWSHLTMARRTAAGEFNDRRLVATMADGTAAHQAITGLMFQLAPAPPAAGGAFADRMHAADVDESARRIDSHDLRGGPDDPRAVAVARQLRGAAQCLRSGDRDTASSLLATAEAAARRAGIRMHGAPAAPLIARHCASLEALRGGHAEIPGSPAEQGAAYARRLREEDPAGPSPLAIIARPSPTSVTAVDDAGLEFAIAWNATPGNEDSLTVTVDHAGRSITAPAGIGGLTLTARELAGQLTGEWQPRQRRARHRPAAPPPPETGTPPPAGPDPDHELEP